MFEEAYLRFWRDVGKSRKMVLSTSLHDVVTSRTMSVVVLEQKLYFQTDKTFRKYEQLKGNPSVALCIDNIQIEGQCREIGTPKENTEFLNAYRAHFKGSFDRYSMLEMERVFVMEPTFIERWLYIDSVPYVETFHVPTRNYTLDEYVGV